MVVPELVKCHRCANCRFDCELGLGKSMSCMPCIEAKAKCVQPGADKPEVKWQRKHAEEEDNNDKSQEKPKKKVRRESELEAGPSRRKGLKESEGSKMAGPDSELQKLLRRLLARFDCQNNLLEELVELKTAKLYGEPVDEPDKEFEEGREEEAAAELLAVVEEKDTAEVEEQEAVEVTMEGVESAEVEVKGTME